MNSRLPAPAHIPTASHEGGRGRAEKLADLADDLRRNGGQPSHNRRAVQICAVLVGDIADRIASKGASVWISRMAPTGLCRAKSLQ